MVVVSAVKSQMLGGGVGEKSFKGRYGHSMVIAMNKAVIFGGKSLESHDTVLLDDVIVVDFCECGLHIRLKTHLLHSCHIECASCTNTWSV